MATELAKAYVQIVPSASGIKGKITEALGGEAAAAGTASGESFGSNLISKIKTLVATAGLGKIISESISAGSDLQQSLGGIETLFKDNAGKVQEYAKEAYKTTGLSANAYMESVTGFSASLLQGLGGDTSKAADVANMALVDMSDNANKMGTDMESIQYAYQGFAKQNYTMLDNLKLGYGGTKEEMARLLSDAQEITGVKYDMNNLSDVYSAIHAVQGELDITGTTAKEASTTLAGSASSMKAAFSDVLANLTLGSDVGPSLDALKETVITYVGGNLLPAMANLIGSLPSAIIGVVAGVAPALITSGVAMIQNIISGLSAAIPEVITAIQNLIPTIVQVLAEGIPSIVTSGAALLLTLCTGITGALPSLIEAIPGIVDTIVTTLTASGSVLLSAGIAILQALLDGLVSAIPAIAAAIPQIITSVCESLISFLPTILKTGTTIFSALVDAIPAVLEGLISALPDVIDTITTLLPALVQSIADALVFNLPIIIQAGVSLLTALVSDISTIVSTICAALPSLINGIVSSLLGMLPQLIQCGISLFTSLVQALPSIIAGITKVLPAIISSITKTVLSMLPQIIQCGISLLTALVTALPEIISTINDVLPQIITQGTQALVDCIPMLIQCGVQLFTSLIQALPQIIDTITASIPNIVNSVIRTIVNNIPVVVKCGVQLLTSLVQNIPAIISGLVKAIPQIISALVKGFSGAVSSFADVGKNMLLGIGKGISNAVGSVVASAKNAASKILGGVKKFFGIKSPSRVFRDVVGKNLMLGLAGGIEGNLKSVSSAMDDVSDMTTGTLESDLLVNASYRNSGIRDTEKSDPVMNGLNALLVKLENMKVVLDSGETIGWIDGSLANKNTMLARGAV